MFSKRSFIKYDDVAKLYYELSNIFNLAATLCKFCSLFFRNYGLDNMSLEEFLIRNRDNEQNLLRLVDLFCPYFRKMSLFKPSALDFFKKVYKWSFYNYKDGTDLSMNLQEVIDSSDELIRLNGEEVYCQFRF